MGAWFEHNIPTVISLVGIAGAGLVAFVRLLERQKNFEKTTDARFDVVEQQSSSKLETLSRAVQEIGRDVKIVVAWMNRQQGREEGRRIGRRHDDDLQTDEAS